MAVPSSRSPEAPLWRSLFCDVKGRAPRVRLGGRPGGVLIGAWLAAALLLASCTTPPPADLTPPSVTSHTPPADADNVSVHDVIEVKFSEPLAPASVSDDNVQLAGNGSVNLAKTMTLSDDGVLVVAPLAPLALPQDVVLNLGAGVRDLAGNALTPYTYGWTVPSWLRRGEDPVVDNVGSTFIYSALLAVDSLGTAVVASNRETSPQARLSRWDGDVWQPLPLPAAQDGAVFAADMAFDQQDRLVLVWEGRLQSGVRASFQVSRLEGTTWTTLGAGLLTNADYFASAAALTFSGGQPLVAWAERTTAGNSDSDQYVSRWSGTAWVPMGGKLDVIDTNVVFDIDVAIGLGGNPIVAWGDSSSGASQVRSYDATTLSWQSLGASPTSYASPQVLVPTGGGLLLAISVGSGISLYGFNGADWLPAGVPLSRKAGASAGRPSARITQADTVMVAWSEFLSQASTVNVAELTDEGWLFHGEPIELTAGLSFSGPSLALLAGDVPALAVATYEPVSGSPQFVSRTLYRQLNR